MDEKVSVWAGKIKVVMDSIIQSFLVFKFLGGSRFLVGVNKYG